ncbi:MAG: winged helix-turn-helix domain-containing protein [Okeania sp. SIO3C4]|nr:winged helix-turn-helix domain-containing protein [Okeania sp. SIO3B3]NER04466.1 winged helix-turn-helix domain-containing protein [Okeania sp. SIO3C4]
MNPKQHGGGPKPKLDGNFDSLMSAENTTKTRYACFVSYGNMHEVRTGVKVSLSTMYRILKKINISRKKKSLCFGTRERRY